jgi:hypothetical protein
MAFVVVFFIDHRVRAGGVIFNRQSAVTVRMAYLPQPGQAFADGTAVDRHQYKNRDSAAILYIRQR